MSESSLCSCTYSEATRGLASLKKVIISKGDLGSLALLVIHFRKEEGCLMFHCTPKDDPATAALFLNMIGANIALGGSTVILAPTEVQEYLSKIWLDSLEKARAQSTITTEELTPEVTMTTITLTREEQDD